MGRYRETAVDSAPSIRAWRNKKNRHPHSWTAAVKADKQCSGAAATHMAHATESKPKTRSKTFYGIAEAMGHQWGELCQKT